jgi:hypothetical protein
MVIQCLHGEIKAGKEKAFVFYEKKINSYGNQLIYKEFSTDYVSFSL